MIVDGPPKTPTAAPAKVERPQAEEILANLESQQVASGVGTAIGFLGSMSKQNPIPDGTGWCGCGRDTRRGSFFVVGHDKRAQAAVVEINYGNIPSFLVHHGFGPRALNPMLALSEWRTSGGIAQHRPPTPSRETIDVARRLWDALVAWARRYGGEPIQSRLAAFDASCKLDDLGKGLELIARHCFERALPPLAVIVIFPEHGGRPDPRLPGHGEDIMADMRSMRSFDWGAVTNPFRASDEVVDTAK